MKKLEVGQIYGVSTEDEPNPFGLYNLFRRVLEIDGEWIKYEYSTKKHFKYTGISCSKVDRFLGSAHLIDKDPS